MTEVDELRQEYDSGKLDKIKPDLESFITVHRERIKGFAKDRDVPLDIRLRWYIIDNKTINPAREIIDQIEEMKKELWYRHEEDPQLPESSILKNWVDNHAAGWRSHRLLQIIYVFLQEKERYLALLR